MNMPKEITFSEYLELPEPVPLIDVRSPGEFQKGHIPGATNIPLFRNDERAHVGTVYVQQSKKAAIEVAKGLNGSGVSLYVAGPDRPGEMILF